MWEAAPPSACLHTREKQEGRSSLRKRDKFWEGPGDVRVGVLRGDSSLCLGGWGRPEEMLWE